MAMQYFDFAQEIFGKLDSHQQGFVTFEDFIETHTAITSLGAGNGRRMFLHWLQSNVEYSR